MIRTQHARIEQLYVQLFGLKNPHMVIKQQHTDYRLTLYSIAFIFMSTNIEIVEENDKFSGFAICELSGHFLISSNLSLKGIKH